MKKILIVVAAVLMLLTGIFAIPQVRTHIIDSVMSEIMSYYGCPNSRRVKKLNLKKSMRIL